MNKHVSKLFMWWSCTVIDMPDDQDLEQFPVRPVEQRRGRMNTLLVVLLIVVVFGVAMAIPAVVLSRNSHNSAENEVVTYDFPYARRAEWHARQPKETLPLTTPVPYVVIHHSHTPPACYNRQACEGAMRSMQDFHMDDRRWWDIGYNFGVGSDGVAYEGRGWTTLGAHALHFNTVSIGICVIGDWTTSLPPAEQIKTVKALIAAGVELGYIKPGYKLVGHRQVRDTDCPGQAFFNAVKTWDHWVPFPASYLDLGNVTELSDAEKSRFLSKS